MIDLQDLKRRMLETDPGSAGFYLDKGIGDKVSILCQLKNFSRLNKCNVTVFSKNGAAADLIDLFPSLRGRHVSLPSEFSDGYTDDAFIRGICEQAPPGANRLFSMFNMHPQFVAMYQKWINLNDARYNFFRCAWHQMGVAFDDRPEYVELPDTATAAVAARGDFVILCPRAVTVNQLLPVELWVSLAQRAMQKGYRCVVNTPAGSWAGWSERPGYDLGKLREIGCEFFDGSLAELLALARQARHTWLIRSGMADLFSLTEGLSYSVLYPLEYAHVDRWLTLDYGGAASRPRFEVTVRDANELNLDRLTAPLDD
jgi:hypothetical protein